MSHSAEKLLPLLSPYARTPFLILYGKTSKFCLYTAPVPIFTLKPWIFKPYLNHAKDQHTSVTYQDCNNYLCYMECHDVLALRSGKFKSCQGHWVINLHTLVSAGSSYKHAIANRGCSVVHKRWIQSWQAVLFKRSDFRFHHSCFVKRSGSYLRRNKIRYGRSFIVTSCLTTALVEDSHQQPCCTEKHSGVHCKAHIEFLKPRMKHLMSGQETKKQWEDFVKAEICCPKLVPVFTICPCRSVNHYQNASSQTECARSKAIDGGQFCAKLLDTACVGEDKRGLKTLQVRTVAIQPLACVHCQWHQSLKVPHWSDWSSSIPVGSWAPTQLYCMA